MKKYISLLLVCLLLFSGCSQSAQSTADENTIQLSIWHYYGGITAQTFSYLVQRFNSTVGAEQGIVVTDYSYDGVSQLSSAVEAAASGMAGSGGMPSIFASYADSVVPLDELGLIADLSENFTEEELSVYYEPFVEEGYLNQDQGLKILPIAKSTEVLHINATIFDEFSADTGYTYEDLSTWEGLGNVAKAYYNWTDAQTERLNDGKAFFGIDGMANYMIVGSKQLGCDIFVTDQDGNISYNFPEEVAKELWNAFYVPFIHGYYSADAYYRSDDVASGEIIAYVGSTASSYYFPTQMAGEDDAYIDISCRTIPYPIFQNGEAVAVQQGAGMVVSKSTPEQEAAAAVFLKWFTQEDINCGFAVSTGYMPVKNDVLSVDVILEEMARDGSVDEGLPIVQSTHSTYEQLETYQLYTSIPFNGSADARVVLENSLTNQIAADQALFIARLHNEESYNSILTDMCGEGNFQIWYKNIINQLDAAIAQ